MLLAIELRANIVQVGWKEKCLSVAVIHEFHSKKPGLKIEFQGKREKKCFFTKIKFFQGTIEGRNPNSSFEK